MAPLLPKSATFPSLLRLAKRSPSSSLTSRSAGRASPSWTAPSSKKSDLETAPLSDYFSSTPFLLFMALLYLLACTALPSLLAGGMPTSTATIPSRHHRVAFSEAGIIDGNSGHRSVAALLQNRRMALENPSENQVLDRARFAATRHQPSLLFDDYDTPIAGGGNNVVLVDYKEAGMKVSLLQALNASYWNEYPIYENDTSRFPIPTEISVFGSITSAPTSSASSNDPTSIPNSPEVLPEHCPQGAVRLFIAITTRCCTPSARAKRDAIRASWLKTIQTQFNDQITAQFVLSQPAGGDTAILDAADFLREEAATYGDISFVPGEESYRQLPAKTLQTLHYALSSPCRYTHIVKTDDDVFLRPEKMLDIIYNAERQYELDIPSPVTPNADGTSSQERVFDGRKVPTFRSETRATTKNVDDGRDNMTAPISTPWLTGMYLGKLDSNRTGIFPGWHPIRDTTSKWYLSESDLPDSECPLGARWTSGWGYMMSRDVAQKAWDAAVKNAMASEPERPVWWGRLPWEDSLIAILLQSYHDDEKERVIASHHPGFKAAWDFCDEHTVLKHLDNDAPLLTAGLQAQEASGLWSKKEVVCTSGVFDRGDYQGWRTWRNSFPDNIKGGFM